VGREGRKRRSARWRRRERRRRGEKEADKPPHLFEVEADVAHLYLQGGQSAFYVSARDTARRRAGGEGPREDQGNRRDAGRSSHVLPIRDYCRSQKKRLYRNNIVAA
jgi:hypothetical protein